jgi:hypothetical protein
MKKQECSYRRAIGEALVEKNHVVWDLANQKYCQIVSWQFLASTSFFLSIQNSFFNFHLTSTQQFFYLWNHRFVQHMLKIKRTNLPLLTLVHSKGTHFYLRGMNREEWVAPIPGRPCLTGLLFNTASVSVTIIKVGTNCDTH